MNKVYLASPFFNQEERDNVERVAKYWRDKGFEVYVPMEHEIENGWEMPNNTWARKVFVEDRNAIRECDFLLAITYGMNDDAGTAWEIGFAYGIGKPVFVIPINQTTYSLMVCQSASGCITIEGDLMKRAGILQS